MPDTRPGIKISEDGVCNACHQFELRKKIDWKDRRRQLEEIVERKRKPDSIAYDCIVPVSGGKNSLFQSFFVRDELGLHPLCVNITPSLISERGKKNLENLNNNGFDVYEFVSNPRVAKILYRESLFKHGAPARASEFSLLSFPAQTAIAFKIPLIFFGENPTLEYGDDEKMGSGGSANRLKESCTLEGLDAKDIWLCEGLTEKDLIPYQHPSETGLSQAGVQSIFLGYYIPWDERKQAEFAKERGLTVKSGDLHRFGSYTDYDNLDDDVQVISDLLKYYKFGFGRATDRACLDIRHGYISRKEAILLVLEYDGQCGEEFIERFCKFIDISTKSFREIADSFRNPGIWKNVNGKWKHKYPLR